MEVVTGRLRSRRKVQATASEELDVALTLVQRLVRSNLESLQMAKALLLAQELADEQEAAVEPALQAAAASHGDGDAIERAIATMAAAEEAGEEELALSKSWCGQRAEVYRLVEEAEVLLARASQHARARAQIGHRAALLAEPPRGDLSNIKE